MKKRIDVIMTETNLSPSREKAKLFIKSGMVFVDGEKINKVSARFDEGCNIIVEKDKFKYVSRGGLKLEKALKEFNIDLKNMVCLDCGASTGGFTDCMLQHGARKIYSVDVGHGQLSKKLVDNLSVVNLEGINVRNADASLFEEAIDFFTVDVSFISLKLILPSIKNLVAPGTVGVCLVKPQFEVGKNNVGKHGVVRDKNLHSLVVNNILKFCVENEFSVLALDYSPIKGPEGNIEYLLLIKRSKTTYIDKLVAVDSVVENSHEKL